MRPKTKVQDNGGLPNYICTVAKAIRKTGKTTSQAIAIAVSRMKVWASGKGVDKDTQAKAAAALAEWEKLRAKSHAKTAAKDAKMSAGQGEILCLSKTVSFNVDSVRSAWNAKRSAERNAYFQAYPYGSSAAVPAPPYSYIKEMWSDYLIVCTDDATDTDLYKVGYAVDADGDVTFDKPVEVKTQYVVVPADDVDAQMSNAQLFALMATVPACQFSALDQVLTARGVTSAVDTFLELTSKGT